MKSSIAIIALVSNISATQLESQGVEFNYNTYGPSFSQLRNRGQFPEFHYNTYGPYATEVEQHEKALLRPADSQFEPSLYGDSAGVSTGTLSQMRNRNRDIEWNYRPFGPYSKEVDKVGEKAYGRPDDSNFLPPAYGDSAGVSTGTVAQRYARFVQEEPEKGHTDRTYGPYFETGPNDGATKKLDIDGGDGRDKNIPYGPYEGDKPKVGKDGSPIMPGQPRPEDRVIPFPAYGDVGGQNGFVQVFVPSQGIFLVQTPRQTYAATAEARQIAQDVVMKQLTDMDAWQAQHAAAMQQWADDAKNVWDVNHSEILNTYEFD